MIEIKRYTRVKTINEALLSLQETGAPTRIISGGTDLLLKLRVQQGEPIGLIDISDVSELSGIKVVADKLIIGAGTRLSDVAANPLLSGAFHALAMGAIQVGSPQIRNLASIGGNLCNAAPSADTAVPLLALGAQVEIISLEGSRTIPLTEFFIGPGKTHLNKGELLANIIVPRQEPDSIGTYIKHAVRGAMDLAMVGVGIVVWKSQGQIYGRIALGAVAPVPMRALQAESTLNGVSYLTTDTIATVARIAAEEVRPISDVRASAEYRSEMVRVLTKRALHQIATSIQ